MSGTEQYLKAQVTALSTLHGMKRLTKWGSTAEFLLYHGRQWPTKPGNGVEMGAPQQCFKNAAVLAMVQSDEYIYCEGYAVGFMLPVEHAWLIDKEGFVVDPTWKDGTDYFGIAFKLSYLTKALMKQKEYGLINAWRDKWPLLRTKEHLWKHEICTQ